MASPQTTNPDDDADWIEDIVPDVTLPPSVAAQRQRRVDPKGPIVMVETAFMASATGLIWLINLYFPIGPLLQIFFSIPIALIYLRWGRRSSWMAAVIAGLLLLILIGPVRSIQFFIPYGFLGVMLGHLWQRRASWGWAIFLGVLLMVFGTFFRIVLLSGLLGEDLWRYTTVQMTGFLDWLFDRANIAEQPSVDLIASVAFVSIVLKNILYMFVVHVTAWFLCDRIGNPISRPPHWVSTIFEME
jgi:uncharacterized protein YybS (DUF2232 family)